MRGPGRPPQISRSDVLDAAAELGLEGLTIRAVAERLGVSRAAIYHYVGSTAELRRLTARSVVADFSFDDDADQLEWKDWLLLFARAFRRWRLANATADPYLYLSFDVIATGPFLETIETALEVLVGAGFSDERAAQAFHFLVGVVWINSQDQIMAEATVDGRHPQQAEFDPALASDVTPYRHTLEALAARDPFSASDERFEREVAWVISALDRELRAG